MKTEFLELNIAPRRLHDTAGILMCACSMIIALFIAFAAGEMHARRAETVWLVDRAHALEQRAAEDAARAQALLQGAQAEADKQTLVISGKGDAAQVSSL